MTDRPMLDGARKLAHYAPVIPLRGKRPMWTDWPERATREPNGEPEWQQATGVGVVCGARAALWVLDLDSAKGGPDALAALERKHGTLPLTWTCATGGGGVHLYFRWPPSHIVRNSASRIGPGIDVRGEGGQVAAPPSIHPSGRAYVWAEGRAPWECAIADAPPWLLELACPPVPVPPPALRPGPAAAERLTDNVRRAAAYLAKVPAAISGSGGHDQTWRAALAVVRGFTLDESTAYGLLASEYNPRCSPPWSDRELLHKVRSAAQDASIAWGYLADVPRVAKAPPSPGRVPGEDDGAEATPIEPKATGAKATRFTLEPVTKLLAEQIPETEWLLSPYVPQASFGELVGPPGKGKTTFMGWMIAQMAAAGRRCAIIEEEGSRRGLQRLLSRALEAVGGACADRCWFSHAAGVSLTNPGDILDLAELLKGFDFVLFDSFALVTPGVDENTAKEMGEVIAKLKWLRDSTGVAVWLNHHTGKTKWKPTEVPRLGDGRGSSSLPGALDAELSMRPLDDPREGYIEFDLFVTKMREADDRVPPKRISIARHGSAALCELQDLDAATAIPVDAYLTLAVLNALRSAGDRGLSKNEVEKDRSIKGSSDAKRAALQALKYSGQVVEITEGRFSRFRFAGFAEVRLGDIRPSVSPGSPPPVGGGEPPAARSRRPRDWTDPEGSG